MSTWGVARHDSGLPVVLSPSQIVADQNNYDPRFLEVGLTLKPYVLRLSTDASRTLTGLKALSDGQEIIVINAGANDVALSHESASSEASNRFTCTGGTTITLGSADMALGYYDAASRRWRVAELGGSGGGGGSSSLTLYGL